jgi:hypothetical protein
MQTVTGDIVASWRSPRAVIRRKVETLREDRALVYLIVACLLIFIGQWPFLQRQATLDPSVPFDARVGGALMGIVFILPLAAYMVAGVLHLALRALGGRGRGFDSRMALFWGLLAAAPLFLLNGLLRGMLGDTPAVMGAGALMLAGFVILVGLMLHEVHFR